MWHANVLFLFTFILSALNLSACTAQAPASPAPLFMPTDTMTVAPSEVHRGFQCGGRDFAYDFSETLAEFRQKHPNVPLAAEVTGGLVFIAVGQQPHPGYRPQWQVIDSTIKVSIAPPAPGGFYPQVITKPCLVIQVPSAGRGEWEVELSGLSKNQ